MKADRFEHCEYMESNVAQLVWTHQLTVRLANTLHCTVCSQHVDNGIDQRVTCITQRRRQRLVDSCNTTISLQCQYSRGYYQN